MGLLDIIYAKLVADGVGDDDSNIAADWPVKIAVMTDETTNMIGLQSTGGYRQDTQLGENLLQTFQVSVRAGNYPDAEAKWYEVFNSLNDADLSASGVYLIQAMSSGPLVVGQDQKDRFVLTANFNVVRANP